MLYKPKKKSFTYWLWCSTCYTIRIIDLEIESQKFSFTSQDEENISRGKAIQTLSGHP